MLRCLLFVFSTEISSISSSKPSKSIKINAKFKPISKSCQFLSIMQRENFNYAVPSHTSHEKQNFNLKKLKNYLNITSTCLKANLTKKSISLFCRKNAIFSSLLYLQSRVMEIKVFHEKAAKKLSVNFIKNL